MNISAYYKDENNYCHWGRIIQFVGAPDADCNCEAIFIPIYRKEGVPLQPIALPIDQIFFSDQFDVNCVDTTGGKTNIVGDICVNTKS